MGPDRWSRYGGPAPRPAPGWGLETLAGPSPLWGANGIVAHGRGLYVTQVFGSEVALVDVDRGERRAFAPLGAGVVAPDDGAFGADGTFFATAPMLGTVFARAADGTDRVLVDELTAVNGITTDPSGRRLFADEFRPGGRLWELDPGGQRPPKLLADDLAGPNALAVGPDGALWFPLVVPGEIWRYDLDEGRVAKAFDGLANPTAVKFDSAGRLMTSEAGNGHVTRIDVRTGAREVVARVAPGIDNLALGPGDRVFVSHFTDGRVAEVTGPERVLFASGFVGPFGLAALPGDEVLVADGLSVAVVGAGGAVRRTHRLIADLPTLVVGVAVVGGTWWALGARGQLFRCTEGEAPTSLVGRLADPTSVSADPAGGGVLVERGAGRVRRLDPGGSVIEELDGFDRPQAAAVAPDGRLWVTTAAGLVGVDGGERIASVEALAGAEGVAVLGGEVLVADPAGRRVVAFEPGSGRLDVVVVDAPLGPPVAGVVLPHAFAALAPDGRGGVLLGANGDGSVRRLSRAR